MEAKLLRVGAAPVLMRETTGYMTVRPVPTFTLFLYVLLETSSTSLYALSGSSYLAYNMSDNISRPFLLSFFDKPVLEAKSTAKGTSWYALMATD